MTKRQKIKLLKSVWEYLGSRITRAFESSNESDFDWYSDGQQAFWCLMTGVPIKIQPRTKPLLETE